MLRERVARKKDDLIAFLLLLAMVIWFNHEMVWTNQVPFYRDLGPFFYPMRFILAQSLNAGELPLWDRHMGMGFPLLANFQSETFYPPHFLFLLLPFFSAIRALFLFHYLVAASGCYILCRQRNYPPYLALIGAVLFGFGGYTVSLSNLLNHFQAAVWFPWVILFGERCFRSQSWRGFLLLTAVLLVQFLAGSPEIYGMSLGLLFLDGLRFRAVKAHKLILFLLAANVLVAGLAMVQILPTMELFLQSRGRNLISYPEGLRWSLDPLSLINLFFLDREADPNRPDGLRLFFTPEVPLIISLYVGVISLFGVCLWFLETGLKEKGILLALITVALAIAMGQNSPVYPFLFRHILFFELIRFPEKFFFLTYILLLFIALRGFLFYLHPKDRLPKSHGFLLLSIPLLFLFVYLLFRYERGSLIQFMASKRTTSPALNHTLGSFSLILVHLERQIALASGISLLLILWKKAKVRESFAQVLLVALVFGDLSTANRPYQFFLDAGFVNQTSRIVTKPEPYRLIYLPDSSHLHPDYYPSIKKSFGEGVATVFANLLPNTGIFHGFDYLQELDALRRWSYDLFIQAASRLPPERLHRLLGALNVKYITTFQPLPLAKGITLVQHFADHGSYLYRLNSVVPRTYIASKVSQEKTGLKILKRLSSHRFNPLEEVILDRPLALPPQEDFQARAEMTGYTNLEVKIRTSLSGPGILVLTDAFYPGWRVYVDGKEEEILRANLFFRAVPLVAGEHLVEFRYDPRSYTIGLLISLATLCTLVLFSVSRIVLRKRELNFLPCETFRRAR
ncbi:MAG: YfhO family protein [Candidatus Binatia bacterium]